MRIRNTRVDFESRTVRSVQARRIRANSRCLSRPTGGRRSLKRTKGDRRRGQPAMSGRPRVAHCSLENCPHYTKREFGAKADAESSRISRRDCRDLTPPGRLHERFRRGLCRRIACKSFHTRDLRNFHGALEQSLPICHVFHNRHRLTVSHLTATLYGHKGEMECCPAASRHSCLHLQRPCWS